MATATDKRVRRGFPAHCPQCGEPGKLYVELDDTTTLQCRDCDTTITTAELRRRLAEWTAVCDWLESAPTLGS